MTDSRTASSIFRRYCRFGESIGGGALLGLFSAGHVFQISNDEIDLAVAEIIGQRRHYLSGPGAHCLGIADQIVQPLRGEIVRRVLRQVEVRADIGGAGPIELVTGQTLHHEESLAVADRVVRRQTASAGQRDSGEGSLTSFANRCAGNVDNPYFIGKSVWFTIGIVLFFPVNC